jgi:hypothetical protein
MSDAVELDVQRERAAKNQSLFREVNERIDELSASTSSTRFICECANEGCDEKVSVTREDYERIRSDSNRFFVVEGHELPEVEQVTGSVDGYLVVAKLGVGGDLAERLDPRRRSS